METLEEACEVHGIDVNEILEKLNKLNFNQNFSQFLYIKKFVKFLFFSKNC